MFFRYCNGQFRKTYSVGNTIKYRKYRALLTTREKIESGHDLTITRELQRPVKGV